MPNRESIQVHRLFVPQVNLWVLERTPQWELKRSKRTRGKYSPFSSWKSVSFVFNLHKKTQNYSFLSLIENLNWVWVSFVFCKLQNGSASKFPGRPAQLVPGFPPFQSETLWLSSVWEFSTILLSFPGFRGWDRGGILFPPESRTGMESENTDSALHNLRQYQRSWNLDQKGDVLSVSTLFKSEIRHTVTWKWTQTCMISVHSFC